MKIFYFEINAKAHCKLIVQRNFESQQIEIQASMPAYAYEHPMYNVLSYEICKTLNAINFVSCEQVFSSISLISFGIHSIISIRGDGEYRKTKNAENKRQKKRKLIL